MLDRQTLGLLEEALAILDSGFANLPDMCAQSEADRIRAVLLDAARRMQDNYPYPHPLYAGQMLKPPHPAARLAYALSLWINPNNHALDGGRASSAMEREAVAEIARMFGWETHLGHLTGGGTMANLEALWVAREVTAGGVVLASSQAHYTHQRLSGVLGVPFESIPTDADARLNPTALEDRLRKGGVGTVVATVGTTAIGSCDPLPDILKLQERHGFRLHVDAAYGGYFTLASTLRPDTRAVYYAISKADSIVIDPHKHGLQPYGCGCVLFRDPTVGHVYRHESPYTYFSSPDLHLGEISLECSRPGAAAVALWVTQKLLPLEKGGELAGMLDRCREAALALTGRLADSGWFLAGIIPELDIVVWGMKAGSASKSSRLARAVFDAAAGRDLHLALANLPADLFRARWRMNWDQEMITCLRSCLMKPEHSDWLDDIWAKLVEAAIAANGRE